MADRPNIVLVTIDSLRPDHLGCYGYDRDTSPNIDSLAEESLVYTNAFANGPKTKASFPSIFTSTLPFHEGTYADVNDRESFVEKLKETGYSTGGFHRNPWLKPIYGYDDGFDVFDYTDEQEGKKRLKSWIKDIDIGPVNWLIQKFRESYTSSPEEQEAEQESALDLLESFTGGEEPFFVWLHSHATHTPYLPTDRNLEDVFGDPERVENSYDHYKELFESEFHSEEKMQELIDLYDGCVRMADELVGSVAEAVDLDETVLIVASDHGEEFGEHGTKGHSELYDETLQVPLLLHLPDSESEEVGTQTRLLDLPPTVLDIADVDIPDAFQGSSLLEGDDRPVISQVAKSSEESVRDDVKDFNVALRGEGYKYIYTAEGEELYDLEEDPDEKSDLSREDPGAVEEMRSRLEELGGFPEGSEEEREVEDEETRRRLKELGYLE